MTRILVVSIPRARKSINYPKKKDAARREARAKAFLR
jgi:hypothetical protein